MLTAVAAVARLAYILLLIAGLSDDSYAVRERSERALHPFGANWNDWLTIREAAGQTVDPEQRDRLDRCWRGWTETHAVALLPAWYPLWPPVPSKDYVGPSAERFVVKSQAQLDLWRVEQGYPQSDDRGCCDGGYQGWPSPHCYDVLSLGERDFTRSWAIRELSRTADRERIAAQLEELAYEDDLDYCWRQVIYATGEFSADAYESVWVYDGGLLNTAYFDGRRRPKPGPERAPRAR